MSIDIQRMQLNTSSSHGKDKNLVWDGERTTPDIPWNEISLSPENRDALWFLWVQFIFLCLCEKFSPISFEPSRTQGPDLGDGGRQLEFSRTPSHLHHSRGKGSIYLGQLPSREAASTLAWTTFTCRGSSVTKSAYLTLCGAATMHLGLSYRSRRDLVPDPRAYCCEQLLAKLVSATKLCSCS